MISLFLNIIRLIKAISYSWKDNPDFKAGFALCVIILISGTIFYQGVEGWSWIDAFFFSAMMVSTVGLSDLTPQTEFGKLFTVLYVFIGVGVFVLLFSQFARALVKGGRHGLSEHIKGRKHNSDKEKGGGHSSSEETAE